MEEESLHYRSASGRERTVAELPNSGVLLAAWKTADRTVPKGCESGGGGE